MVRFATTYTASERRHARSAINTIRSVVMERLYATRHLGEMLLTASHHASCPAGAGRGFRSLTAFAAEWWGPPEGTGGRWAAMEKAPATARPNPPPISLSSPRLRRTIPRNATALSGISGQCAICNVRLWSIIRDGKQCFVLTLHTIPVLSLHIVAKRVFYNILIIKVFTPPIKIGFFRRFTFFARGGHISGLST